MYSECYDKSREFDKNYWGAGGNTSNQGGGFNICGFKSIQFGHETKLNTELHVSLISESNDLENTKKAVNLEKLVTDFQKQFYENQKSD